MSGKRRNVTEIFYSLAVEAGFYGDAVRMVFSNEDGG